LTINEVITESRRSGLLDNIWHYCGHFVYL